VFCGSVAPVPASGAVTGASGLVAADSFGLLLEQPANSTTARIAFLRRMTGLRFVDRDLCLSAPVAKAAALM